MAIQFLEQLLQSFTRWVFSPVWLTLPRLLKISSRFLRVRLNFHVYAWPSIYIVSISFTGVRTEKLRNNGNPPHGRLAVLQLSWKLLSCGSFWCFFHPSSNYSLALSLSLALILLLIQFQGRLPTGLDWTGLDWTGLDWPSGMVIFRVKAETGFGKVWSCLPVLANWNGALSFLCPSLHPCISDSKINRSPVIC